jgi:hypothetical protein
VTSLSGGRRRCENSPVQAPRTRVAARLIVGGVLIGAVLSNAPAGAGGASDAGRSPLSAAATSVRPVGNGTWAYDEGKPGRWASRINDYNAAAAAGHRLRVLMSYGTDLEMYCPGNDPSKCTKDDLYSFYTPGSGGAKSTAAYAAAIPGAVLAPIIDGAIGSDYLSGFNELSPDLARAFADKVTTQVCADPRVSGIQFDLEPFDVRSHNGQFSFYLQIAKDFASTARGCRDTAHPRGRFFSVFTVAGSIKPGTSSATNVERMLNAYGNGYIIDSLYDLSGQPGGHLNPPATFAVNVAREVGHMKRWSNQLGIRYGFGVPGAASAHEYTACIGNCFPDSTAHTGYPMLRYSTAAIDAIRKSGARSDRFFVGNYLWYFGPGPQDHGTYQTLPAPVTSRVLTYFRTHL